MIQPQLHFIFFFSLLFISNSAMHQNTSHNHMESFHVGVILDMSSMIGKVGWSCLSMALSDFYNSIRSHYKTRLVLHLRDSQGDKVKAAFAALELLNNEEVQVIIGPQKSTEANFVVDLGEKSQVPIISFSATGSSLSLRTPYFVLAAQNDYCQLDAITTIIQTFKWREVIAIYEDSHDGNGIIPYLVNALQDIQTKVSYRSGISHSATDDQILQALYKLLSLQTKVFIVHMSDSLGYRFFLKAKDLGMMSVGYVWIMTSGITSLLDSMDNHVIESMQGVLGVKPYIKRSKELDSFKIRWKKRFLLENPRIEVLNLNVFGLWAYDTIQALAMAAEIVGVEKSLNKIPTVKNSLTNLTAIRNSRHGSKLLHAVLKTRFKGLSGDFHFVNGQLLSSAFEIVNVIGEQKRQVGLWTREHGISQELRVGSEKMQTVGWGGIVWPGQSTIVPKGWMIPSGKKLRIGVPVKQYFKEFVRVDRDPFTNLTTVSGQVIDVFSSVMESLPYVVPYEFIPFEKPDGSSAGNYNDLVYQVYLQRYDAVVGDVMITENRSLYVDFTLPYAEGGVFMVVPIKYKDQDNAWIFVKPLSKSLWLTSGAFFIITGFVIWVLEHRINDAFRGPPSQHVGMLFWFSFSTLVFAHSEKVVSYLTRFVVIIWIFVVLILSSSYTASLSSLLTMKQLEPTDTSIQELLKKGEYVGCQQGTFIRVLLKQLKFDDSKLKFFNSSMQYHEALQKGSQNGGISAYIDSVRFINFFMARYCDKYTVTGPIYKTDGVGFAFPKGSPLVADVSREILKLKESDKMAKIDQKWFGSQATCSQQGSDDVSNSLSFYSFRALFIITGSISSFALLVFFVNFLYKHRHVLNSRDSRHTIWLKFRRILNQFDKKDMSLYRSNANVRRATEATETEASPGRSLSPLEGAEIEGTFSTDLNLANSLELEEMVDHGSTAALIRLSEVGCKAQIRRERLRRKEHLEDSLDLFARLGQ